MGANLTAMELHCDLTGLGTIRPVEGRAVRPTTGWEALTRAERAVAQRAARGMSNREIAEELFVSQRTVETHISRALAKLGQRSRVELAKAVLERH
jgi:DNA-binding NarL/FixJ family response regulator